MIKVIILGVVILLVIAVLASGYVKAPPDTAYIISGIKKNPKVLIGRAGIKIPLSVVMIRTLAIASISTPMKSSVGTSPFFTTPPGVASLTEATITSPICAYLLVEPDS